MAYAAVVSLVQTIEQLLPSDHHHQSPVHYPDPKIEALRKKLRSLQATLEKIFPVRKDIREEVKKLETKVRDVSYKAQDTIEFFLSGQTVQSKSEETIPGDLQEMIDTIDSCTATAEGIASSIEQSNKGRPVGDSSSENDSSTRKSVRKREIVGQEKDKAALMNQLKSDESKLQIIPIYGMAGIGKTTLARSIYEDHEIERKFDVRAWVTVSQESHVRDIYLKLLGSMATKGQKSEISGSTDKIGDESSQKSDTQLGTDLYQKLYNTHYLIVIDDMWEKVVWDQVKQYLPDDKKRSRILLTTRLVDVADYAKSSDFRHKMELLGEEDSWKLLRQNAFEQEPCPPLLEPIGRGIAKNCGGLPLSLTVVGGLLYRQEKSQHYWNIVLEDTHDVAAAAERKSDKTEESDEFRYREILYLSYNHLPGRLRGCFLYMGAFPEDSEIFVSKLIQLWVAEGFLTPPSPPQSLEFVAEDYLKNLVDRNLILVRKISSDGQIRTCGLHDTLRDLAKEQSKTDKFFHTVYRYNQQHSENKYSERRLSVHKNILVCLENVYESAKSFTLSRTLLYAGLHHHHPLPYCLTFDLLRVLDALTVYFISFPNEIIELIHLRYLAMTYNGKILKSVFKLKNLQVLIVRRHPKIIFLGASFLPDEIWNMPQLRHLVVTETCLPDLSSAEILVKNSILLANLQTLSNVDAAGLTKEVLQNMRNLRKLVAWIESPTPVELYLDELEKLESFKFIVLNPIPDPKEDSRPKIFYPKSLRKLTLSGCGFPWGDMTVIGQLPDLEVLKLREFAFQGEEWEPNEEEFGKLKFLLLEALELKTWRATHTHFPELERLIIRHCYALEDMSSKIANIGCLQLIELVDCSPYAAYNWAGEIEEIQENAGNKSLQVRVYSSWE